MVYSLKINITENNLVTKTKLKPFVKWPGGKRQLLPELIKRCPIDKLKSGELTYFEPFVGGGALLFELMPKSAIISDANWELTNCYWQLQHCPTELIRQLEKLGRKHCEEVFYEIRALDRDPKYKLMQDEFKAARIIYLNKTCFNGLFRVNSNGQFNVPFGRYTNPNICDKENLLNIARYLGTLSSTMIFNFDFTATLTMTDLKSFVYLDPPYDPVTDTASFTGYCVGGFDRNQQIRLKKAVDKLNKKGCQFLLSNSDTPFINELYRDYKIEKIEATRSINSKATGRGKVSEVLVSNC